MQLERRSILILRSHKRTRTRIQTSKAIKYANHIEFHRKRDKNHCENHFASQLNVCPCPSACIDIFFIRLIRPFSSKWSGSHSLLFMYVCWFVRCMLWVYICESLFILNRELPLLSFDALNWLVWVIFICNARAFISDFYECMYVWCLTEIFFGCCCCCCHRCWTIRKQYRIITTLVREWREFFSLC